MVRIDLSKLQKTLRKILRAYSIKSRCMAKRRNALMQIATRFKDVNSYPDLYKDLRYCLRYEKKLLGMILKKEKGAENQIIVAMRILKSSRSQLEENQKNLILRAALRKRGIKIKDLIKICYVAIDFLEQANDDIKGIQKRMEHEEKFITEPTEENFNKFIIEWNKELSANEELLKHIKRVVKKIKERHYLWKLGLKFSPLLIGTAAVAGGGFGYTFDQAFGEDTNFTSLGAGIGVGIMLVPFVYCLYMYFRDVSEYEISDKDLIEKIMKAKSIKMHWWNKL